MARHIVKSTKNKKVIALVAATAVISVLGLGHVGRGLVAGSTRTVVGIEGLPSAIARQEAAIFSTESDLILPGKLTVKFVAEKEEEKIEEREEEIVEEETPSEEVDDETDEEEETEEGVDEPLEEEPEIIEEEPVEETPEIVEEEVVPSEEITEETPTEEVAPETPAEETPAEEITEETPAEETVTEEEPAVNEEGAEDMTEGCGLDAYTVFDMFAPVAVYADELESVDIPVTWKIDSALSDAASFNSNPAFEGFKYVYKPVIPKSYDGYLIEVPDSVSLPTITVTICDLEEVLAAGEYEEKKLELSDEELLEVDPYDAAGYTPEDYAKVSENEILEVIEVLADEDEEAKEPGAEETVSSNEAADAVSDNDIEEVIYDTISVSMDEIALDEGGAGTAISFSSDPDFAWMYYSESKTLYIVNTSGTAKSMPDDCAGEYKYSTHKEIYGNNSVDHVVIGPNITRIGNAAFKQSSIGFCFKDITMPGVKSIGKDAFEEQSELESINGDSGLKDITFIDEYAFCRCKKLKKADLSNAETIGLSAFFESGLESVALPTEKNCTIDIHAFGCTPIRSVFLPSEITLEHQVFYGCTSLNEVVIECGFTDYLFSNSSSGLPIRRIYYNKDTVSGSTLAKTVFGYCPTSTTLIEYSVSGGNAKIHSVKNVVSKTSLNNIDTSKKINCFDLNHVGLLAGNQIYPVTDVDSTVFDIFSCHDKVTGDGCGHAMQPDASKHKMVCDLCGAESYYCYTKFVYDSGVSDTYRLSQLDQLEEDIKNNTDIYIYDGKDSSGANYIKNTVSGFEGSTEQAKISIKYEKAGTGVISESRPQSIENAEGDDYIVYICQDYYDGVGYASRGYENCKLPFTIKLKTCGDTEHLYKRIDGQEKIKCEYCGKERDYYETKLSIILKPSYVCDGQPLEEGEDFALVYSAKTLTSGDNYEVISDLDESLVIYRCFKNNGGVYEEVGSYLPTLPGTYKLIVKVADDHENFRKEAIVPVSDEFTITECTTHSFGDKHYWDDSKADSENKAYRVCSVCEKQEYYNIKTAEAKWQHDYKVKGKDKSGKLVCSICNHEREFYTPIIKAFSPGGSPKEYYVGQTVDIRRGIEFSTEYTDDYGNTLDIPTDNKSRTMLGLLKTNADGSFYIDENLPTVPGNYDLYIAPVYKDNGTESYYDNVNGVKAGYSNKIEIKLNPCTHPVFDRVEKKGTTHYRVCNQCEALVEFDKSSISINALTSPRGANGRPIARNIDFKVTYKVKDVEKEYDDSLIKLTYAKVADDGSVGEYKETAPYEVGKYKIKAAADWNDAEYGKPCESVADFEITQCKGAHTYDEEVHYYDEALDKCYKKCTICGYKDYDAEIVHKHKTDSSGKVLHYYDATKKSPYYVCDICGYKEYASDITHEYGKPYTDKDGKTHKKCKICGYVFDYTDVTLTMRKKEATVEYDGYALFRDEDFYLDIVGADIDEKYIKYSYAKSDGTGKRKSAYTDGLPKNVGVYLIRAEVSANDEKNYNAAVSNDLEITIFTTSIKVTKVVVKNKPYDGNKKATVEKLVFLEELGDDKFVIDKDYKIMSAEFKDAKVGKKKEVVVTYRFLSTEQTANYDVDTSKKSKLTIKGKADITEAKDKSSSSSSSKKKDSQSSKQAEDAAKASADAKKAASEARLAGFGEKEEPKEEEGDRIYPIPSVESDALSLYDEYSSEDIESQSIDSDDKRVLGSGETYDIYTQTKEERKNTLPIVLADIGLIAVGFIVYFLAFKRKKGEKKDDE